MPHSIFAQIQEQPPQGFDEIDPSLIHQYDPTGFGWIGSLFQTLAPLYFLFLLWMIIECVRKDPDRFLWLMLMLWLQPFGAIIYFFARWLPGNDIRVPKGVRRWTRGKEIDQLRAAALQIGNAHQFIQLGDALRETGKYDKAGKAYAKALEKEPENCQALWGASLVDIEHKQFDSARTRLAKLLKIDPQYKFGDVSLAYGKVLSALHDSDAAIEHFEKHVKRWRHPEGLYRLATLQAERGESSEARKTLQAMLLDINSSPRTIARKYAVWKSKARKLFRKLPGDTEDI